MTSTKVLSRVDCALDIRLGGDEKNKKLTSWMGSLIITLKSLRFEPEDDEKGPHLRIPFVEVTSMKPVMGSNKQCISLTYARGEELEFSCFGRTSLMDVFRSLATQWHSAMSSSSTYGRGGEEEEEEDISIQVRFGRDPSSSMPLSFSFPSSTSTSIPSSSFLFSTSPPPASNPFTTVFSCCDGGASKAIELHNKRMASGPIFKLPTFQLAVEGSCFFWKRGWISKFQGHFSLADQFVCLWACNINSNPNANFDCKGVIPWGFLNDITLDSNHGGGVGSARNAPPMPKGKPVMLLHTRNHELYVWPVDYRNESTLREMSNLWMAAWRSNAQRLANAKHQQVLLQQGLEQDSRELTNHKLEFFRMKGQATTILQQTCWDDYFKNWGKCSSIDMFITSELEQLVTTWGIPLELRGSLWLVLSGANYKASFANPNMRYKIITTQAQQLSQEAGEPIEQDLRRSFQEHPFYIRDEGIDALRRVLRAIVWLKQTPNAYCQSMNFIAALLLCIMSEEEAFWVMKVITDDILVDYHIPSIRGVLLDEAVFSTLLETHCPQLYQHFISVGIPCALFIIPWFLCMYIGYLPWDQLLAMFDCTFARGRNVLLRVALAILDINRSAILRVREAGPLLSLLKETSNLKFEGALETALNKFGLAKISDSSVDALREKVARELPFCSFSPSSSSASSTSAFRKTGYSYSSAVPMSLQTTSSSTSSTSKRGTTSSSSISSEEELQKILLLNSRQLASSTTWEDKRRSSVALQKLFVDYSSNIEEEEEEGEEGSGNGKELRDMSSEGKGRGKGKKKRGRVMDRINLFLDSVTNSFSNLNCGDFSCAPGADQHPGIPPGNSGNSENL